jgi:glutamate-1-semialdehyde 2,1-aminomutase
VSYPEHSIQSKTLYERAKHSLPGGNTRTTVYMKPFPIYAERGEGCRIWDVDGVARIDCINNFTAAIHGYAHPQIVEAATKQIALGSAFGLPTQSEIDLAELIRDRVASVDHVRFTNSGTEAVMMALKAARAYTGRAKIAKCEGAYHGSYDYAEISLDSAPDNWGSNTPNSVPYAKGTPAGVMEDVVAIPFNDVEAARHLIREHGKKLAAVLIDPMPNRAGLIPASPEFIKALREETTVAGVLLIFDEVISYRLAYGGAQSIWAVKPDLTCFGKIIGGGFPVGAVGGSDAVMSVFDPTKGKPALPHGGTFSANPVTMRAGLVSMQLLDQVALDHLDKIGNMVRVGINAALRQHRIPGAAVGQGSLLKVHFKDGPITDYRSVYPSKEEAARLDLFVRGLLNNGVLAASYGLMALSTAMTIEDAEEIVGAADQAIKGLAAAA